VVTTEVKLEYQCWKSGKVRKKIPLYPPSCLPAGRFQRGIFEFFTLIKTRKSGFSE